MVALISYFYQNFPYSFICAINYCEEIMDFQILLISRLADAMVCIYVFLYYIEIFTIRSRSINENFIVWPLLLKYYCMFGVFIFARTIIKNIILPSTTIIGKR